MNILVTVHTCNSSIFFLPFRGNLLPESTDFLEIYPVHFARV